MVNRQAANDGPKITSHGANDVKGPTLPQAIKNAQRSHDYSWCIEWFRTFSELAGDTISAQRMVILLSIAECDPHGIDQGELAKNLGIEKSVLSRSLNALLKYTPPNSKGKPTPLIQADQDEQDRRRRIVSLTARGRSLIGRLYGN